MRNMVAGLEAKGHEVLVIHPGLFSCFPCPTYPEIRMAIKPYAKLTRLVNEFGPQAIHITAEGALGLAGRRYCLRHKLSFTSSVCTRYPEFAQMRLGLPASWLYRFLRWFHAPATHTMVAAPSLLEELEEMGFRGLTYWGRGVGIELFRPREKELLPLPRPISLYMGRVAVEKNLEVFLSLDLPGSKVVIGDGPALGQLRRKYPQVSFPGRKTGRGSGRVRGRLPGDRAQGRGLPRPHRLAGR